VYEEKTYENIKGEILKKVSLTDKREGSFVNDMVSAIAYEMEGAYSRFDKQLGIMFVNDSAGNYIDKRGEEYGIVRKEGTYARGECTFIGNKGAKVAIGDLCATTSGLLYNVTTGGTLGDSGMMVLPIRAVEIGDKYNVLAEEINTLPASINGITAVANVENILGGTARETDEALAERILARLQTPATSGNAYHYRLWAMDVEGVGDAKVFPLDNGPGTVTVMPITAEKRSPGEEILTKVTDYIDELRPIGATVTIIAPQEVLINVTARINISLATTVAKVKETYETLLEEYIKGSVFRLSVVDYYKCLSMFYEIEGVQAVQTFTINGGTASIAIDAKEIQVAGAVVIEGASS